MSRRLSSEDARLRVENWRLGSRWRAEEVRGPISWNALELVYPSILYTGTMAPPRRFPLTNLLRGRMAERILTVLSERGGYRVTRLGIEELFGRSDEKIGEHPKLLKYLDQEEYLALGLPGTLTGKLRTNCSPV